MKRIEVRCIMNHKKIFRGPFAVRRMERWYRRHNHMERLYGQKLPVR